MSAEGLLEYVVEKAQLDSQKYWGLYEVICEQEIGKGVVIICRKNASLKIFVIVIPKEGLTGVALPILIWYDTDYSFVICSLHGLYCKVGVIPKEGLAGPQQRS